MGVKQSKLTTSYVSVPAAESKGLHTLTTLPARLEYFAKETPDKEAVVFASTDNTREVVTFHELLERSRKMARALIKLGVRRGEIVAINVRPCPEWLYTTFGAMMAGAKPFGLSFTYKDGSDLIGIMKKLQSCSCLIIDPGVDNENWNILLPFIDSLTSDGNMESAKMPYLRYLIYHDVETKPDLTTIADMLDMNDDDVTLPGILPDDVAMLFQTSGSTGMPKAVVHTHASLLKFTESAELLPEFSRDDRLFSDRPMNWIGGFPLTALIGMTRVAVSGFCEPPKDRITFLMKTVQDEHCNMVILLPNTLADVIARKDETGSDWFFKMIFTGGQPVMKQTANAIGTLCKYLAVMYGATEFAICYGGVFTETGEFDDFCSGYPLPGFDVKIVDETGKTVPVNTQGEILVRSAGVFQEYINDPDKTRTVLTEDGWYKTDDIGVMKDDGSLRVEGRQSNMIISGGYNVAPEILEMLIQSHPDVHDAILVPVKDSRMYQVICACVILKHGSDVDETNLRRYIKDFHGDRLSLFTVLPKFYMFVDSFSKTNTGKTSRKALAKMAEERFGQK